VLSALDELGLAEKTIVVLWVDHGWHLGDSWIWGKHTPFERAVRSPLLIRAPGMKSAGRECEALVETLDIYPTLISLCSLTQQETEYPLDGNSLRPLLDNPDGDIRGGALSYWNSAVSIRTKTHRLIVGKTKNDHANVELYDIAKSPDPINNIANDEPELVKQLLRYVHKKE
jgi:arylsulfatase A-like enzyme